ncbi:MAG TPA: sugar ABC transporter substrate-binding protein [Verrucomicrobia bacterium]|nr:sugar ABC transporter substrate-binding protein [Verrucomicrobiota bacterium]
MTRSNVGAVVILAISAVLFTSGVVRKISSPQGQDDARPLIAVIPKGTASMWWEVVRQGAERASHELGYEMIWTGPEQETDREKQIQAVEDSIAKRVVGIVLGPNDAQALVRPVEKIKTLGIPCVIIDSGIDAGPEAYASFAATDNFAGGADGARRLAAAINGRGNVIITKFVQNSASTDARAEGFKQTLAREFPEIKVIAEQFTLGTVEDGRQKTEDLLLRNKGQVDGLFAVNQPVSVGAYKAIQSLGLAGQVKMVGFDSDPVLLEGIERGEVAALIVQNPFEIGYQGVRLVVEAIANRPVPKAYPIPSMIVDRSNLAEMKQKFPAALGL